MQVYNNKVLVLPDGHFTSDGEFEIFDSFEPAKHWNIMGTVLAIPNRLVYNGDVVNNYRKNKNSIVQAHIQEMVRQSLEYDVKHHRLLIGDQVIFRYIVHNSAIEDEEFIDFYKMGKALLIDYDQLYMRIRDDSRILLNGWILVEPIDYTQDELISRGKGAELWVKDKRKEGMGIVREIGWANSGYIMGEEDIEDIKVGDTILFRHSNNVSIEWSYHKVLNEGKYAFYRMQRKDILAYK